MNETDAITVSDKAIFVNGAQDSWALEIHKLDYLWECLENTIQEVDENADAFAPDESGEYPHEDMDEARSLANDEDNVAWR